MTDPKPIISWYHSIVGITIKKLVRIAGLQINPSSQNFSSKSKSGPNHPVWRYLEKKNFFSRKIQLQAKSHWYQRFYCLNFYSCSFRRFVSGKVSPTNNYSSIHYNFHDFLSALFKIWIFLDKSVFFKFKFPKCYKISSKIWLLLNYNICWLLFNESSVNLWLIQIGCNQGECHTSHIYHLFQHLCIWMKIYVNGWPRKTIKIKNPLIAIT